MSCYHPLKGFRTPSGVVFSGLVVMTFSVILRFRAVSVLGAECGERPIGRFGSCMKRHCIPRIVLSRLRMGVTSSSRWFVRAQGFSVVYEALALSRQASGAFYMCGEYGPLNFRPHYHACLFGVSFQSDRVPAGKSGSGAVFFHSPTLEKLWTHGRVSVQDLTKETAGYCARYIMKKRLGILSEADMAAYVTDDGVIRRREYAAMSLKPGIGASWYKLFGKTDVHRQDFVIADGSRLPVPRYYDKLMRRTGNVRMDALEFEREKRAKLAAADNSDERRLVREEVHLARVRTLTRGDCDDA